MNINCTFTLPKNFDNPLPPPPVPPMYRPEPGLFNQVKSVLL